MSRLFSRRKRMMEDLDQDIRDFIERETRTTSSAACRQRKRAMQLCASLVTWHA